jgi:hypothetical protein
MAVADASFNTSTDAISCGDITFNASSTWIPSIIYKGELSWVMDPPPRTLITAAASGEPSVPVTCTPANLPAKAWAPNLQVYLSDPWPQLMKLKKADLFSSLFDTLPQQRHQEK